MQPSMVRFPDRHPCLTLSHCTLCLRWHSVSTMASTCAPATRNHGALLPWMAASLVTLCKALVNIQAPYTELSPDTALDAIAAAGLDPDGRLLALNSYENRVYQVGLEEGGFVVAKFYRPRRWSDEAIAEEHAFAHELAEAELPVIAPLA